MARSVQRKILLYGFVVGVLAFLFFHQGTLHVLHNYGALSDVITRNFGRFPMSFNRAPIPQFGLPVVALQVVWGGLWGIIIALLVRLTRADDFDIPLGLVFGAVAITLVEMTVLPTHLGLPQLSTTNQQAWLRAGLLNGAFGFGTVFLLRPFAVRG